MDSGSQSTIISRSTFHQVARKLHSEGEPLPKLTLPTVKVYGKYKRELDITAQTELSFLNLLME